MKKNKNYKIEFIDNDIAFTATINNQKIIFMNRNLKKYPSLYNKILLHEIEHLSSNKKIDFHIDLKSLVDIKTQWELFKFCLKYPKSLSSVLPITKIYGKIGINWLLFYYYLIIIAIALVILYFYVF